MTLHEPMRVLQVFGTLDRGGADTSILTFYRNIDRSQVQFDFVVHGPRVGALEADVLALGGNIHRVPRLSLINIIGYLRAWSRLLAAHPEYRIVHGHYFTISAIYLAVAKLHGRKTVAHSHSTIPGKTGRLITCLNWWLRYGANLRLACSEDAARFLYGDRAVRRNNSVIILKNPIEVERFAFDPSLRAVERGRRGLTDQFVVGHVGRFDTPKNHAFLLEVFQEVVRHDASAVLLLVGGGSLRSDIEHRALERGLGDSVIFAGVTPEVPALLQAMDVFVLPSLYEGFGVVAIEAQASGLPTVVSDTVPAEAVVTELVDVVPLSATATEWASAILRRRSGMRVSHSDAIKSAGFDGADTARLLQGLYLKLAGGVKVEEPCANNNGKIETSG